MRRRLDALYRAEALIGLERFDEAFSLLQPLIVPRKSQDERSKLALMVDIHIGMNNLDAATAAAIAKQEALVNSRFHLFRQALGNTKALNGSLDPFLAQLERDFRSEQYLEQLADLEKTCQRSLATARFGNEAGMVGAAALALEEAGVVLQP